MAIDQHWAEFAATPITLDRYRNGYDAVGNCLWKENVSRLRAERT